MSYVTYQLFNKNGKVLKSYHWESDHAYARQTATAWFRSNPQLHDRAVRLVVLSDYTVLVYEVKRAGYFLDYPRVVNLG